MAGPSVSAQVLAAALLLLLATVSGSTDRKSRGSSRIPFQFSEEERVAFKEALKGAIQIPTVSFSHEESNTTALAEFGEYIRKVFPTVFQSSFVQHEVVGTYSHLFTVQGSDSSLQPYMLMAHFDVVPAPEEGWEVPPFSGLERDGFIYGRGTLDNKNSVMAILQALELLLIRNYSPKRSFFIALGHDEEVSGKNGATKISALLQARGVQLAFLVDEGSFILEDFIPNIKKPFAMISVSEKGALDLMLQVNMTPSHSSAPPKETSIGILSAAVSRLEQTPMPNMFGRGPLKKALKLLAKEFPFPANIVLSNLWLFRPIVSRLMERNHITNALVRTTTALTLFKAGIKVNVIPPLAQATINFRIHPSQTVHEVCTYVPKSSEKGQQQASNQMNGQCRIGGICIANTDSRHSANLTNGIYLFNPVFLQSRDFSSIHGINEKISVQNYENQVKFMFELIQNADTYKEPIPHQHEL
ncbi:putative carboxypeptidase PM20D1 [Cricetulus griseus]|nr:putative carboxypeptidase PM20D1 [Cricetulus griseus]